MRQITPRFYVSPQISAEDMPMIAQAGIRRVLCNRPDAEVPPSHQAAAIRAAALAAGLEFEECALTHQTMTQDNIRRNMDLATGAAGPVLAYCASGTRSTIAWALAMAGTEPVEQIIGRAAQAGYDIENLRATLIAIAAHGARG
jgi:uncharacterized protein (TIGR01244 family)